MLNEVEIGQALVGVRQVLEVEQSVPRSDEGLLLQALDVIQAVVREDLLECADNFEFLSFNLLLVDYFLDLDVAVDDVLHDLDAADIHHLVDYGHVDALLVDLDGLHWQILVLNSQFRVCDRHTLLLSVDLQLRVLNRNLWLLGCHFYFRCFNLVWVFFWLNYFIFVINYLNLWNLFQFIRRNRHIHLLVANFHDMVLQRLWLWFLNDLD